MGLRKFFGSIVAIASVTMFANQASATSITVTLTGTVEGVASQLSSKFSIGDVFTMSYIYNPDTTARAGSTSSQAVFDAVTFLSFHTLNYTAGSTASSEIQIDDNVGSPADDRYGVTSRASDGLSGPLVGSYILNSFADRFDDLTTNLFSNALNLPSFPSLNSFTSNAFFVNFATATNPTIVSIDGEFTSAQVIVNNTPEPATMLLLGSGLFGLNLRRRKSA